VDEGLRAIILDARQRDGQRLWEVRTKRGEGTMERNFTIVRRCGGVKQAGLTGKTKKKTKAPLINPYAFRIGDRFLSPSRHQPATGIVRVDIAERLVSTIDADVPVKRCSVHGTLALPTVCVARVSLTGALLAGLLSGIALLLTFHWQLWSVSYAVSPRRREIGVRDSTRGRNPGRCEYSSLQTLTTGL